jgi:AbrB family looped-hinge helix DNA binding protein
LTYESAIDIFTVAHYGLKMTTVKISPKYQIVIPKEIRNKLNLKPGQKMQALHLGDRIEFILLKDIKEARGFLKGIDTEIIRERDRS